MHQRCTSGFLAADDEGADLSRVAVFVYRLLLPTKKWRFSSGKSRQRLIPRSWRPSSNVWTVQGMASRQIWRQSELRAEGSWLGRSSVRSWRAPLFSIGWPPLSSRVTTWWTCSLPRASDEPANPNAVRRHVKDKTQLPTPRQRHRNKKRYDIRGPSTASRWMTRHDMTQEEATRCDTWNMTPKKRHEGACPPTWQNMSITWQDMTWRGKTWHENKWQDERKWRMTQPILLEPNSYHLPIETAISDRIPIKVLVPLTSSLNSFLYKLISIQNSIEMPTSNWIPLFKFFLKFEWHSKSDWSAYF